MAMAMAAATAVEIRDPRRDLSPLKWGSIFVFGCVAAAPELEEPGLSWTHDEIGRQNGGRDGSDPVEFRQSSELQASLPLYLLRSKYASPAQQMLLLRWLLGLIAHVQRLSSILLARSDNLRTYLSSDTRARVSVPIESSLSVPEFEKFSL
ncbi:hypothetical protein NL676_028353 [Syzygium grande]|nr:hypothetical protein NL676_028353 [Syzygium grande]